MLVQSHTADRGELENEGSSIRLLGLRSHLHRFLAMGYTGQSQGLPAIISGLEKRGR